MADGARACELAGLLGVELTTLQSWRRQFASDGDGLDGWKGSHCHLAHRLSEVERQRILLSCNEPDFAVPPLFLLLIPAARHRQFQEMWYPNQQPSVRHPVAIPNQYSFAIKITVKGFDPQFVC